jgi:GntR family transcriptional regulator
MNDSTTKPKPPSVMAIAVEPASTTLAFRPLYEQVIETVTKALIAGEWKPGDMIPSEFELARRYGVSQGTVRKAIDEMAGRHLLIRRQGKGTFVATHQEANWQYRFLRMLPDVGEKNYPASQFLGLKTVGAKGEIANALQLKLGEPTVVIKRVLVFDGEPMLLDEIVLQASRVPGISLDGARAYKGSMYSYFESEFGMRMVRAREKIKAVAATASVAKHLNISEGAPLLCVDRVAYTYDNQPVEWRRGLTRTDGYSYVNELS